MSNSNWFLGRHSPQSDPQMRLFCFPYAGGGASIFHGWAESLPGGLDVCRVQLPGRENRYRETPFASLDVLVDSLIEVLRPLLDVPFAFFGHSMGSLISFELSRKLQAEYGLTPAHLFVSGHRAPQFPDVDPPLHHLPDSALVQALQRRYNGIPQAVLDEPGLMALFLPMIRADLTIVETYAYAQAVPLTCPISCYVGAEDPRTTPYRADAWQAQTTGELQIKVFPGQHFFIQSERVAVLSAMGTTIRGLLENRR